MFSAEQHMNGDYRFSTAIIGVKCIIKVSHGILQFELLLRKSWSTVLLQLSFGAEDHQQIQFKQNLTLPSTASVFNYTDRGLLCIVWAAVQSC